MDGFDRAVKIPDDGYPNMGITEVDSEKSNPWLQRRFLRFCEAECGADPEKNPLAPCESEGTEGRDQIEHERLPCVCGGSCKPGTCKKKLKRGCRISQSMGY